MSTWEKRFATTTALTLLLLMGLGTSQLIKTETNIRGRYTTGNRLDYPEDIEKFVPEPNPMPMLITQESAVYLENINNGKNDLIVDFSSIDPKIFMPENHLYDLAVQRRGIPLFYMSKVICAFLLCLILGRTMYGYCGGYLSPVKIIRAEKKKIGVKVLMIGAVIYSISIIVYFSATFFSLENSEEHFFQEIEIYAKKSHDTLESVIVRHNY